MWLITIVSLLSILAFLVSTNLKPLEAKNLLKSHYQVTWHEYEYEIQDSSESLEKVNSIKDDADLSVPQLLTKYGYPVEIHHVTTEDGYILELHRIPHGRNKSGPGQNNTNKPVAFLQHGFLASSADWIMNTVDKALAYKLADSGYDVFLGNARGNTYSRNHTKLTPNDKEFWDFSFHEMGIYDIPAVIDHILEVTKEKSLFYVGHSMGTVMFWITMIHRPEYNDKIRLMSALAPVAYVKHIESPIRIFAPFATEAEILVKIFGDREFLPHQGLINILRKLVCTREFIGEAICENIVFLIAGFDRAQLNETMLPVILGHTPAGASTHTLIHFAQGINSGKFRQFDYGKKGNIKRYGQEEPPEYPLGNVSAPVALYWSQNDWLAPKDDVFHLAPQLKNLKQTLRINYDRFTHLDFIFGIDSDKLVYDIVLDLMKKF